MSAAITVEPLDGYGPNNGRWWGVYAGTVLLEASPRKRAAVAMAHVYASEPAVLARKLAEVRP